MEFGIIAGILNIIIINLILSGDNAVVIAMAAMGLPENLRKKAIFWGATLAVVLRVILTFVAALLLKIPLVQFAGGVLLTVIAIKLLKPSEHQEANTQGSSKFFNALLTILWADLVMSLDNVLAVAGAAQGNLYLLIFGLAVSIPIVLAGSTLLTKLLDRFSWLSYAGAGVLAYTAGEMIIKDKFVEPVIHALPFAEIGIPVVLILAVVGIGWMTGSKREEAVEVQEQKAS